MGAAVPPRKPRASSVGPAEHRDLHPLAGEQSELDVQSPLPQGTAAHLLGLPHAVLRRVAMEDELLRRRGVAAPGPEEHQRRLTQAPVAGRIDGEVAQGLVDPGARRVEERPAWSKDLSGRARRLDSPGSALPEAELCGLGSRCKSRAVLCPHAGLSARPLSRRCRRRDRCHQIAQHGPCGPHSLRRFGACRPRSLPDRRRR